ncbi:hypothetical protein ROHU_019615 [Labeo rohita]|uniref:Uncharacterized protein n=1 Tax=Labeo rohita TaxID=84645 RepID=A0A498N502_LABRO|nr:hypothetical protein ROHU_019615 [Labeo rohita]
MEALAIQGVRVALPIQQGALEERTLEDALEGALGTQRLGVQESGLEMEGAALLVSGELESLEQGAALLAWTRELGSLEQGMALLAVTRELD